MTNDANLINEWVSRSGAGPSEGLGSIGLLHTVPSGPFFFGSRFHPREAPRREINLPEFEIAHAPVLVKQYTIFIDSGGYATQRWWSERGWAWRQGRALGWGRKDRSLPDDWTNQKYRGDHPIVGLSAYEAEAYCAWLSAQKNRPVRLPTEEEWEKAARGEDGRPWPWGEDFRPGSANTFEAGANSTAPVGAIATDISSCGAADMGGNVQEWTSSAYQPFPEENIPDRQNLRVARGGSFNDTAFGARASYRRGYPAGYYYPFLGFRVVVK